MTIDFSSITLKDALDLAILIEQEAEERYDELTNLVGGRYEGDASDVFRRMRVAEQKHGASLRARRKEIFGDAESAVTRSMFWEVEAPDYGKPRVFMSPRQAMMVALESEHKAHAFFVEALPHVKDSQVRALFEELRDEEVEHARLLEEHMKGLPEGPDVHEEDADEPPAL
jgi:erythrin-vacuolar iron transport family protein